MKPFDQIPIEKKKNYARDVCTIEMHIHKLAFLQFVARVRQKKIF